MTRKAEGAPDAPHPHNISTNFDTKDSSIMNDQTKTQTCGNCANYSRGKCTAWLPPDDDLMAVKKVSVGTPACPEFLEQCYEEGGE